MMSRLICVHSISSFHRILHVYIFDACKLTFVKMKCLYMCNKVYTTSSSIRRIQSNKIYKYFSVIWVATIEKDQSGSISNFWKGNKPFFLLIVTNFSELLTSDESTDSIRDSENDDDFKRKKSKKTRPHKSDDEDLSINKRFVQKLTAN